MQTTDLSADVRQSLEARGIPAEIAERITAARDLEDNGFGHKRETIEMGYTGVRKGKERRILVASINMAEGDLNDLLVDDEKLATFLDAGMTATPAAKRLELPQWVKDKSRARENARIMSITRKIAENAAAEANALAVIMGEIANDP